MREREGGIEDRERKQGKEEKREENRKENQSETKQRKTLLNLLLFFFSFLSPSFLCLSAPCPVSLSPPFPLLFRHPFPFPLHKAFRTALARQQWQQKGEKGEEKDLEERKANALKRKRDTEKLWKKKK